MRNESEKNVFSHNFRRWKNENIFQVFPSSFCLFVCLSVYVSFLRFRRQAANWQGFIFFCKTFVFLRRKIFLPLSFLPSSSPSQLAVIIIIANLFTNKQQTKCEAFRIDFQASSESTRLTLIFKIDRDPINCLFVCFIDYVNKSHFSVGPSIGFRCEKKVRLIVINRLRRLMVFHRKNFGANRKRIFPELSWEKNVFVRK